MRGPQQVEVSITDTGHGIEPSHLTQLFSPFFTTKPEGMGLGLSISRSIIEAHLGRMFAESEVGVGTTFQFSLPVAKAEAKT
jgi:two-component system sensor kinase FixL